MFQALLASQNELKSTIPTFDASVMAAIQHLSQTNRNQIAALESNFKMLQQAQLAFKPSTPATTTVAGMPDIWFQLISPF